MSNENFFQVFQVLLSAESSETLALSTSILWVLLYDFEKVLGTTLTKRLKSIVKSTRLSIYYLL
jgi:hypothetical protein